MKTTPEGKTELTESAQQRIKKWQEPRQVKQVTRNSCPLIRHAAAGAAAEEAVQAEANTSGGSLRLCEEISHISEGTCFLGFSRGKDSIAAWIQLRKFFTRIIPFHCASVPHLGFVDASLDYYERLFETKILRYMDGACLTALDKLHWQPPESEEDIDSLGLWRFDKHAIIEILQRDMGLPKAWCAFGINMTDSIDRRIWVEKIGGRNEERMTFYPCYDWKKEQIISAIKEAGILLPSDYKRANRTMAAVPSYRHMSSMVDWAPSDYERVLLMYPMLEAEIARQEFRQAKFPGKATAKVCHTKELEDTQ